MLNCSSKSTHKFVNELSVEVKVFRQLVMLFMSLFICLPLHDGISGLFISLYLCTIVCSFAGLTMFVFRQDFRSLTCY